MSSKPPPGPPQPMASESNSTSDSPRPSCPPISDYEQDWYYNGISSNHPPLFYRSDTLERPFIKSEGESRDVPVKAVRGVGSNTPLKNVWPTLASQVRDLIKARGIRYTMILPTRFLVHASEEDERKGDEGTMGPIVLWIAVNPRIVINGPSLENDDNAAREIIHTATLDILQLLRENNLQDVTVEWYRGVIERFTGPALFRCVTGHGGLATLEDAEGGSLGLLFHENQDEEWNPSPRVFGLTAGHVLRKDSVPEGAEEFKVSRSKVTVAGARRFEQGVEEINSAVKDARHDVLELLHDVDESLVLALDSKAGNDLDKAKVYERDAFIAGHFLAEARYWLSGLEPFAESVGEEWLDFSQRSVGGVHWAPPISVDCETGYTRDLATFEVDPDKFRPHYRGNIVDVGSKYSQEELEKKWPQRDASRSAYHGAPREVIKIGGALTPEQLTNLVDDAQPDGVIVGKVGSATDFTLGRLSGLDALVWSVDTNEESREMAIFNYDRTSGSFADKGDSGSLVFDGQGRMAGLVHSGIKDRGCSHVTFATPAWWVIEQVKLKYPHADFDRTMF
ncbi:hypothetical protein BKA70DRAFT_1381645 [Coprinopsis sp. MPI-PUGE-AT-0042]|nr:hypothetical protein BKA70DRAFT_1381645 [Coprinopsis sp. MPI-PUGE-AT-0042]